jgi:peroxiredoxin
MPNTLIPRQSVPALEVPLIGGGNFILGENPGEKFDLLVFYRGLHCPKCISYLKELAELADDFSSRGIQLVALSCDTQERAQQMRDKIGSSEIKFGYNLSLPTARQWGLYISTSRGKTSIGVEEPALFSEPGLFLIKSDSTLYYGAVQTMPFARPQFQEILAGIDFAIAKDYPARGHFTGEL